MGACTALRTGRCLSTRLGRLAILLLAGPVVLLDLSNFPGTKTMLSRWSPIGQLAYGQDVVALGFQYTSLAGERVRVDWVESPGRVSLKSRGRLFSLVEINDREVFVDRRCGAALVELWA
ncbi:hypothetical protein [Actinotalea sp. C106]|uniref:hypothetical protein n=1 Tax=Actinotalea sp. C106 TaxID=2908644 RepID=UPI0020278554|nr:hypothetical protein [Actinotalea sp. C106]